MNKQLLKDSLGWGFILWLVGYVLGFVFFTFVPQNQIGWFIMPIGTIIALWVLFKKVKGDSFGYYFKLAFAWALIAIVFDYFFIIKLLNSVSYYKPDVYAYYAITFALPLIAGLIKNRGR
ncbi:MAG: hypothetical protein WC468_00100 [Candidatus Paceibacterota bacterium]